MQEIIAFITDLIERFSSRSFVVAATVMFYIARNPDITVEQLIGLLVGVGLVTARAVAEDNATVIPPIGTEIAPEKPEGEE